MENANVVVIEDNEFERLFIKKALSTSTHEVVREAATLVEAIETVEDINAGRLACEVVVLDGNLSRESRDCADAKVIAELILAHGLALKLIGFSTYVMEKYGVEVDVDLGKHRVDDLAAVIDTL